MIETNSKASGMIRMARYHGSVCWEELDGESFELCQQDSDYECREFYTVPSAAAVVVPEGYVLVPSSPVECLDMGWAYIDAAREVEPGRDWAFSHAGYRAMLSAAPTPETASPWISVDDRLPESGRTVLAFYLNSHGKGRRIRAEYIASKSRVVDADFADPDTQCIEYDEATDTYYLLAGWYELIDNWDEYTSIAVVEGEVSAWTPLPAAPEQPAQQAQQAEVKP